MEIFLQDCVFSFHFTWLDNVFSIQPYRRRFVCCPYPIPCSCYTSRYLLNYKELGSLWRALSETPSEWGRKPSVFMARSLTRRRILTVLRKERWYVTLKVNSSTNYTKQHNLQSPAVCQMQYLDWLTQLMTLNIRYYYYYWMFHMRRMEIDLNWSIHYVEFWWKKNIDSQYWKNKGFQTNKHGVKCYSYMAFTIYLKILVWEKCKLKCVIIKTKYFQIGWYVCKT